MSRTWKESNRGTVIEIIKRDGGTFDFFLNRRLEHGQIDENRLEEILCIRFGYCGEEFKEILNELVQNGRAERHPS